ncbi:hypothetical protein GCM10007049_19980 [Echinicola pacifica]|uniref:Helix-hairpin-helix motif-containing protein n=2 Tax=Echinicola pacifica TaxID=346377 RepID=A0A918UQW1_9BACT|nr:hypothetical protein GCM10007049_19980 [Echinicola pacifica]
MAQDEFDFERFAEELFSMQEEDIDYEQVYESLLQRFLNPLDLNACTSDELQSTYILSPEQANAIITYRNQLGPFISIYELQAVPGLDLSTLQRLKRFIYLNDNATKRAKKFIPRILSEDGAYFIYRYRQNIEQRKGFTAPDTLSNGSLTSRYLGAPSAQYLRFRSQHTGDFSIGLTMDQDMGEKFTWSPSSGRYGYNYLSYHLSLYNRNKWKVISLGDYQAQFGQGLVYGAGFSIGKGAETITTTRRSSTGIKPYTSATEQGYFRGLAATYQFGRVEGSLMASSTPIDATYEYLPDSSRYIQSISESGYHRTLTEISRKSNSQIRNLGMNANYNSDNKRLQIGINSLFSSYEAPYFRSPQPYNQFEFGGKDNYLHSLYFSYNHQNHFFFGEYAQSKSRGNAAVLGMMSSLSHDFDMVVHVRKYDRDFHSFYGNAFAEGSRPINESGLYLGLSYHPSRKFQWSGYIDQFKFPWLRYRLYQPSTGYEWLNRLSYSPFKALKIYAQMREEVKDRNRSSDANADNTYQVITGIKRNYLINMDYSISKNIMIRTRLQTSTFDFDGKKTSGYTLVQDLNIQHRKWKWGFRAALFDTEDYDNRQYVYEKNVLWAFSIPSYYGQGLRYYVLGQYQVSRKLTTWMRWARTSYTDRQSISSGLQEVQGNHLSELTLQLRYQFNK